MQSEGVGNAGGVEIITEQVSLTNGGQITTATFGEGNAGKVKIEATDKVFLDGENSGGDKSGIFSSVQPTAVGNGGEIELKTDTLQLDNGASVNTNTLGEGNAGDINLNAENIAIENDSQIEARTFGELGGNIIIKTTNLAAKTGGNIRTTTEGNSSAGNIDLEVTENLTLDGENTGLFADTTNSSTGKGGNIRVISQEMTITNTANVGVNSQGEGEGGSIAITAENLNLNQGNISAETVSNNGGDINLQINSGVLEMAQESQISTTAGTAEAGGNGGNITIFAPFIVTTPTDNSDITANAFLGNGGNIEITTQGIFGLEVRETQTILSDITASSQFGLDGTININTAGIDPTRGLENLPQEEVSTEVALGCETRNTANAEFYNIGLGGIPSTPESSAEGDVFIFDWTPFENIDNVLDEENVSLEMDFEGKIIYGLYQLPCGK